jgi:predicted amidohydrolase YtcJ
VRDRLSEAVAQTEDATPVRGAVYDDSLIEDNRHLTRNDLDRVSTDTPIVVTHVSGHRAYLNSPALEAAGLDESTEDPEGGCLARDDAGRLTGVLYETALRLTASLLRRPSRQRRMGGAASETRPVPRREASIKLGTGLPSADAHPTRRYRHALHDRHP